MSLPSFQSFPIWINLAIFVVAAAIIWLAGTRLERYTDAISTRTGLGKAFLGLLLLATATSLPEIATTVTATLGGNVDLALHNLLGGVVMQTAVLAIADIAVREGSLTRFTPKFVLLIEGVGLVQVLAAALLTMALGGKATVSITIQNSMLTIGLGPLALFLIFLIMMYMTYHAQGYPRWQATESSSGSPTDAEENEPNRPQAQQQKQAQKQKLSGKSLSKLFLYFTLAALAVLVAGWAVAVTGEALAEQTGLGSSFIGFTLVAIATSLPELSTTLTAVSNANYEMAISNVFGSNAFDVALLFLIALLYGGEGYIFQLAPASVMFAAALGIIMTCIYLWGLLERENRTFLRMGWDSLIVLLLAVIGTVAIYFLRQ